MVAFCSNAVGLRRCAGSKRDEDESFPCDCIDCILDARHPVNAIIGSTSNILIEPESPFNRGCPPRTLFIILWGPTFSFSLPFPKKIILIATFVEDADREEGSKNCRTNKFLAWLKAKARVTDAEERLSDMFDKAESFLRSLRDQPSIPFDPNNWPEDSAVAAALRERREAQRAFDQANAALSPADRKLLKSIPTVGP